MNTVTLLTCWKDGHTLASSLDLEVEMALDSLASMSNIDMLSPLGALIIKLDAQLPSTAVDDTLELCNNRFPHSPDILPSGRLGLSM